MLGFVGLDLSNNLSLYTVPAALVVGLIPFGYATSLGRKDFDHAYPRTFAANVSNDGSIDKAAKLRIQRALAASQNGLETLGYFAAAVTAANAAGVKVSTLNGLSLSYVASRALYNVAYIQLQENRTLSPLRSVFWVTGLAISTTLFICAGNKFA